MKKHRLNPAALAFTGALVALSPGQDAMAAPACPSQDFAAFLAAFADDVAVQKAFVALPLRSDSVDADAQPEPKTVTAMLDAGQLPSPLMPSRQKQAARGLNLEQSSPGPGEMRVKLFKPDSGLQVTYSFRKEACWMLYRMQDDSL